MNDPLPRIVAHAERRRSVLESVSASHRSPGLPLRFWRQQVHFSTPASDPSVARKAVEGGYASALQTFERLHLGPDELARELGIDAVHVARLLSRASTAVPLVMIDGEDAQAPVEEVVIAGREAAGSVFREAAWSAETLRFYRPNGLETGWTAADLATVLFRAGPGAVDGVVFPKAEHAAEVTWLDETLAEIESALGVAERSIKVQLLVESAWAVRHLDQLALASLPRLAGIIFGIADYSSDVGLPQVHNAHPSADWVRAEIVNVAGAVGVPAIDTMTFEYPVADPRLAPELNRLRIVSRLKRTFDDTRHGIALGMAGKWAGHPIQAFAVLLAFQSTLAQSEVEVRIAEILAYERAVAAGKGTAMFDTRMIDRATDRHAREVLRRAYLLDRLTPEQASACGFVERGPSARH